MTGDDASFEQALTAAHYLAVNGQQPVLVGGADEMHPVFSAVFDPSVLMGDTPADGGGMLLLETAGEESRLTLQPGYFAPRGDLAASLEAVLAYHGGPQVFNDQIGAVLVGLPAAHRESCTPHLDEFRSRLGFEGPWIDYRPYIGEFASASAVATVAAMALLERGVIPGALAGGQDWPLAGRAILLLGVGATITTMRAAFS
jgi:3-oxoacyl-[acyl-carrier-protein] synthase-1/3-oxoacyl-[acyl-carrier-protein] synthase II